MNEIVWPTIDSEHLIVDSKQMLILEKEMFSDGMPQEALMEKAGIQISRWLLKRKPLLKYGITVFIGGQHRRRSKCRHRRHAIRQSYPGGP